MNNVVGDDQKQERLPTEERLARLLQHLGVEKAHFAARMPADWKGLVARYPEAISSLTLFCQSAIDPEPLRDIASQLMIVVGDPFAKGVGQSLADLPQVTQIVLGDYECKLWDDVIAERSDEIGSAMVDFMGRIGPEGASQVLSPSEVNGEVAGLTYHAQGSGQPLILLPMGLAPSQWEPLLPRLSDRYCTITLGGPEVGTIPALEARGLSRGYQRVLKSMMDEVQLQPGETILEVGCGTGVIDRWLARHTSGANRIVGVDINSYLLKEALALVQMEGLDSMIDFREGNAEDLPFRDNEFDVTVSSTVMEEVNADKMLAEMIRVTKSGGRVGVIVRAEDMPWLFNIPLPDALKAKVEGPDESFDEGEVCASASLYRRFQDSILTDITMTPLLAVFDDPEGGVEKFIDNFILTGLGPEEKNQWQAGMAKATDEKTFFFTWPHHCAVGTKPA